MWSKFEQKFELRNFLLNFRKPVKLNMYCSSTFMSHCIKAVKIRPTSTMKRVFLLDEISRSMTKLESFRLIYFKSLVQSTTIFIF